MRARLMLLMLLLLRRRRSSKEGPVRNGAIGHHRGGICIPGLQLTDGGFFPDRSHPWAFVVVPRSVLAMAVKETTILIVVVVVIIIMDIVYVLQGAVVGRNRDRW